MGACILNVATKIFVFELIDIHVLNMEGFCTADSIIDSEMRYIC